MPGDASRIQFAGGDSARRGGCGLARHLVIESLPQPVVGAAAGLLASKWGVKLPGLCKPKEICVDGLGACRPSIAPLQ